LATVLLHDGKGISTQSGWPSGSDARFERVSSSEAIIRSSTSADGWLVLSEMFYPGWKAEVDGQSVSPVRAYGLITAVPIAAGEHTIRYWYSPLSFWIGAIVTILTWTAALICGVSALWKRCRSRSEAR
jgi:uncharacterized membrane protein YfhO